MIKALRATQAHFESSSERTPEYLAWHKLFKREFTEYLTEVDCTLVEISKPNHFDMSGFFTFNGQAWYFSISDLRWSKENMLIRTATHYKDYTGGRNMYVYLNRGLETFIDEFSSIVHISIQ